MKYTKEDLENYINIQKLPYLEIGRMYGVSDTFIKKMAKKLGVILPIRAKFKKDFVPHNKGTKEVKICQGCSKEIKWFGKKYCFSECSAKSRALDIYHYYLSNEEEFCTADYNPSNFKRHFLEDQNYKCAVCSVDNEWNAKPLIFVLDHIDGDAANNRRDNLRLVCPNCDSQLDTFKSKNKNSARKKQIS